MLLDLQHIFVVLPKINQSLSMSEKKENITGAALKLFADEGYDAVSTNKIAKQADVSEGLIFKHFENKEGLLKSVMEEGLKTTKMFLADVILEDDPREVISKALELPFVLMEKNGDYLRLQQRMRWHNVSTNPLQSDSMQLILTNALSKMSFPYPNMEAKAITYLIEGIASNLSSGKLLDGNDLLVYLKKKYGVY
jgi:AcrR family transcriptional regulator